MPFRYLHFFSRFRSVVPLRLWALVNLLLPPSSMSVVLFVSLSWRRAPAVIFLVSLSQVLSTSTSDLNWFLLEQHHGLPPPHTSVDHTSSPSYHHVHNLVTFDIASSRFQLSVSLGPLQLLLSHVDSPSWGIVLATFLHLLSAGHSSILISSPSPVSSFYNIFVESSLHVRTSLKVTTCTTTFVDDVCISDSVTTVSTLLRIFDPPTTRLSLLFSPTSLLNVCGSLSVSVSLISAFLWTPRARGRINSSPSRQSPSDFASSCGLDATSSLHQSPFSTLRLCKG